MFNTIYPSRCLGCGSETSNERGLCQACWKETHFATGQVCERCGIPVLEDENTMAVCDYCMNSGFAWDRGRCSVLYAGTGRKLAIMLKHSDRLDLAPEMAKWMYRSAESILEAEMIIIPVPLHRFRLLKRRYNQAAVLAQYFARYSGLNYNVDALLRIKSTAMQKDMGRQERLENLQESVVIQERFKGALENKSILLVDDVMTTGATLSACANACLSAGAKKVNTIVFARVARL